MENIKFVQEAGILLKAPKRKNRLMKTYRFSDTTFEFFYVHNIKYMIRIEKNLWKNKIKFKLRNIFFKL